MFKSEFAEIEPRMLTRDQACTYTGMGRTNFTAWAREIGAERKFGKAARFDRTIIDAALDALEPVQR